MENRFLVKIQTNVNKKNIIHNNFLSEVFDTIKMNIKIGVAFFV